MTFGRGPLLSQKSKILLNGSKNYHSDFKSKIEIEKCLNMSKYLVFHSTMYLDRKEKNV